MSGGMQDGVDVLVVDDDEDIRSSYAEILRGAGYTVAEAADGFVALEHLWSAPVRAMVLDAVMPVLDGLQLLDRLDDPPPVVLVTAREYDKAIMARRSKISLYLQKPISPRILLEALERAISGKAEAPGSQ